MSQLGYIRPQARRRQWEGLVESGVIAIDDVREVLRARVQRVVVLVPKPEYL